MFGVTIDTNNINTSFKASKKKQKQDEHHLQNHWGRVGGRPFGVYEWGCLIISKTESPTWEA